jgi:hypothetical protein
MQTITAVREDSPADVTGWGKISWLIAGVETPGEEQTFGVVTIASFSSADRQV